MYKDVCKRISAFMLTVCLIVTMVEWPTTVWAGQGTVNTYRNGDGVLAGAPCEAQAVAAVFTANRNADGAELLDSIDFYAHVDDGNKATATVEYYKDVEGMAPDAGTSCDRPVERGVLLCIWRYGRGRELYSRQCRLAGYVYSERKLCGGNSIYL